MNQARRRPIRDTVFFDRSSAAFSAIDADEALLLAVGHERRRSALDLEFMSTSTCACVQAPMQDAVAHIEARYDIASWPGAGRTGAG
jgi:hypothetical protein